MTVEEETASPRTWSIEEIFKMIDDDDVEGLKAAIEQDGFDVNRGDLHGKTALHYAAGRDKFEILEILSNNPEIDVNARTYRCWTPLMFVACNGSLRSLKLLLEKGADASKNNHGLTALSMASDSNHFDCAEALLKTKNCVPEKYKETVYDIICKKEIFEIVKRLIIESSDDDLYYINIFGGAVLHYACKIGSLDTVKLIVEKDIVDINVKEPRGGYPLHSAICGIEASYMRSAFRDPVRSPEIADYLIQKGAILDHENWYGYTAYSAAARYDDSETFLEKYEPAERFLEKTLIELINCSRMKTLKVYAEKCIKCTEKYPNGPQILNEAVYHACIRFNKQTLQLLLSWVTDKDFVCKLTVKATDSFRTSGPFEALYERSLELETDITLKQKLRSELFVTALKKGHVDQIDYFIERGFDLDTVDPFLKEAILEDDARLVKNIFRLNTDDRAAWIVSFLMQAVPELANFISAPIYIKISDPSQDMCLICRDEMEKDDRAIVLPCKHVFHNNCFSEWGNQQKICPYCQRPVNKNIQ